MSLIITNHEPAPPEEDEELDRRYVLEPPYELYDDDFDDACDEGYYYLWFNGRGWVKELEVLDPYNPLNEIHPEIQNECRFQDVFDFAWQMWC